MLTVREYCSSDRDAVTELLVELQSHLVSVDNENIQVLSDQYRRTMHFYEDNAYAPRNIEMYKHIGENT